MSEALTPFPLPLPGTIYRSSMPFGAYDVEGRVLAEAELAGVTVVVPLVSAEECREKAQRDLFALYAAKGLVVVPFAMADFQQPRDEEVVAFDQTVERVLAYAIAGRNVLVHCSAGIGRTGMFVSCLAVRALQLDGDAAIAWVRRTLACAVETRAQEDFVGRYAARIGRPSRDGRHGR